MQTLKTQGRYVPKTVKLQTWLLLLSPILHIYRFVSIVTVGELALAVCVMISLANVRGKAGKVSMNRSALAILLYFCLSTLVGLVLLDGSLFDSIKEYLVFVIYFMVAIVLARDVDLDYLSGTYVKIGVFAAGFIILQFVAYLTFKIHIPGLIPNVTMNAGVLTNAYITKNGARANGFFTEPAMAARYLGIPLIISIHHLISAKKIIDLRTVILVLGLLFTLSGNAIITILVGAGIYLLFLIRRRTARSAIYVVALLAIVLFSFAFLENTAIFSSLFSRINELSGNGVRKSGYIRVVRGYLAYYNLPLWAKLIGIGFGNYDYMISSSLFGVITSKTTLVLSWVNAIQYFLIYGGAIGLLLYLWLIFKLFKAGDTLQKRIALLFLAYSFIAAIYAVPEWAVFMVFLLCKKDNSSVDLERETEHGFSHYPNP